MAIVATLVKSLEFYTTLSSLLILLSSYVFYTTLLYPNYISPLRHIPGPPNISKHNKHKLPSLDSSLTSSGEKPVSPSGNGQNNTAGSYATRASSTAKSSISPILRLSIMSSIPMLTSTQNPTVSSACWAPLSVSVYY